MFFHPFLFSCYRYVGKLNVVPQVSEALCIFLWSFFLFSLDWLISFELPSTVLLFSCVGANLRLNPSSKLFVSFIVLFKVRISSWLLFYTLYLSFLRFSICWLTIFSFFKQDFLPFFECVCVCVCISCSVVSNSLQPHGPWSARLLCPWDSAGKNTGVGCHALLQGVFPTQALNRGLNCTADGFSAIWASRETYAHTTPSCSEALTG